MKKLTLNISHNVFLTKEERYLLSEGNQIEVSGVSIPVWFHQGSTSEPANEVFCKYRLTNMKENQEIRKIKGGYKINIPNIEEKQGKNSTSDILKDVKDGGSAYIAFKQFEKRRIKTKNISVIHCVEIKPIETLLETLS